MADGSRGSGPDRAISGQPAAIGQRPCRSQQPPSQGITNMSRRERFRLALVLGGALAGAGPGLADAQVAPPGPGPVGPAIVTTPGAAPEATPGVAGVAPFPAEGEVVGE